MGCRFRIEKRKDKATGKVIETNVPIYADITLKGLRVTYSTGYRVDADKWLTIKDKNEATGEVVDIQRVSKNSYGTKGGVSVAYNIINADLDIIRATVEHIIKNTPVDKITAKLLVSEIDEQISKVKNRASLAEDTTLWGLFNKFIETAQVTEDRKKTYYNAYTNLRNFEKYCWRRNIEFADCNGSMMVDFDNFMLTDGNHNGRYDYLLPRVRPRPKGKNTRIKIMRVLSAFFKWVQKNHGITVTAFNEYSIGEEVYEDPYFLTIEERDKLIALELEDEKLKAAQDIFIFHCFMGARVGDLYDLTRDNVTADGYIEFIADKTKTENPRTIRIPMRKEVMEVVEKYKDLPDGRLFPYMDRQTYNECLRELILKANIMRKVPILNKITMTKELKYLWEVFSSHNVRKSFIAACKRKGIQNSTIASMSGHQPNSKAFNRYFTVMDEEKVEALDMI